MEEKFCHSCGSEIIPDKMGNCPNCGTWLYKEDENNK